VTYPFVSIFINFLHPRSKYYDNVVLMGINVLFFFFSSFTQYPLQHILIQNGLTREGLLILKEAKLVIALTHFLLFVQKPFFFFTLSPFGTLQLFFPYFY